MVNENNFDCVQMVKGNSISDGQFNSRSYEVKKKLRSKVHREMNSLWDCETDAAMSQR